MSELEEPVWAVLGERGVESLDVTYAEAVATVERLAAEDVRGLCVITARAARLLTHDEKKEATDTNASPEAAASPTPDSPVTAT